MAKKKPVNPRIACKCGSELPKRGFNFCVCKDVDRKGKPKFFDSIFIESVKN